MLDIIIVNWNVRDLLADCLRSVEADVARSGLAAEIWVVDNASHDGSVEMLRRDFPQVRLIASEQNLGFAGGNNAALRALGFTPSPPTPLPGGEGSISSTLPHSERGDGSLNSLSHWERAGVRGITAVLLLNPDTLIQPGALATMLQFMQTHPHVGIVGAQLQYGDGSFQEGAFAFPGLWQLAIDMLPQLARLSNTRLNGRYPRAWYAQGQPFRIGHPLGAAMLVRREAIEQVGLLDEAYHMYVEEVDWSRRITQAGWQAYCVPQAVITHLGGQSTGQVRVASLINLWRSRYLFYRKYYHPMKVWLARWLLKWGFQLKSEQDLHAFKQGQLSQLEFVQRQIAYQQIKAIWQGRG